MLYNFSPEPLKKFAAKSLLKCMPFISAAIKVCDMGKIVILFIIEVELLGF